MSTTKTLRHKHFTKGDMPSLFYHSKFTMHRSITMNIEWSIFLDAIHMYKCLKQQRIQDFPKGGAPTPQGGRQHTILPNFPENCTKSKEFGCPGGGAPPAPPLNPPLLSMKHKIQELAHAQYFTHSNVQSRLYEFIDILLDSSFLLE